jgi:hypothetical protein
LPSFNTLPDPTLIPDDATLSQMSLPQVRGIIQGLRSQLSSPDKQPSSAADDLMKLREENNSLTSKLHLILYGPASERDIRIIPVLRQELEDVKNQLKNHSLAKEDDDEIKTYQVEIQELKAQLSHTENINEVLRKSMQRAPSQDTNQVLTQIAKDNGKLREQVKELSDYKVYICSIRVPIFLIPIVR